MTARRCPSSSTSTSSPAEAPRAGRGSRPRRGVESCSAAACHVAEARELSRRPAGRGLPPPPSAPSQFRWAKQDLNTISGGTCNEAETDGTGHVALSWDGFEQPHATRYAFVDPASGTAAGTYQGTRLGLIGQLSGFIGANCVGAICAENYVVVDPVGKDLFRSAFQGSGGTQANDPTGGNGPRAIFG